MLSLAGVLASQSPQLKAMSEKRSALSNLNKKEKVLQKQYNIVSGTTALREGASDTRPVADEFGTEVFTNIPDVGRAENIEHDLATIARERFNVSPSMDTYGEALRSDYEPGANVPREASQRVSAFRRLLERNTEIRNSREFARMITEGVPDLSFNPNEYTPPERRER